MSCKATIINYGYELASLSFGLSVHSNFLFSLVTFISFLESSLLFLILEHQGGHWPSTEVFAQRDKREVGSVSHPSLVGQSLRLCSHLQGVFKIMVIINNNY